MGTTTTFPCPSCGKRMQACAPKPERIPGGVIRNRGCLQCGYRVKTKETIIDSPSGGLKTWVKRLAQKEN